MRALDERRMRLEWPMPWHCAISFNTAVTMIAGQQYVMREAVGVDERRHI